MRTWALLFSAAAHVGIALALPTGGPSPVEEPPRVGVPLIFEAPPSSLPDAPPSPPAEATAPIPPATEAPRPPPPVPKPVRPAKPLASRAASPPSPTTTGETAAAEAAETTSPSVAALPPSAAPATGAPPQRSAASLGDNPPPVYPGAARRRGQEGTVRLRIDVAADGTAKDVAVVESSGHRLLDEAALRAVQNWRFRPAMVADQPVSTVVEVPVAFRLDAAR